MITVYTDREAFYLFYLIFKCDVGLYDIALNNKTQSIYSYLFDPSHILSQSQIMYNLTALCNRPYSHLAITFVLFHAPDDIARISDYYVQIFANILFKNDLPVYITDLIEHLYVNFGPDVASEFGQTRIHIDMRNRSPSANYYILLSDRLDPVNAVIAMLK